MATSQVLTGSESQSPVYEKWSVTLVTGAETIILTHITDVERIEWYFVGAAAPATAENIAFDYTTTAGQVAVDSSNAASTSVLEVIIHGR
jgi:hypothetical protein